MCAAIRAETLLKAGQMCCNDEINTYFGQDMLQFIRVRGVTDAEFPEVCRELHNIAGITIRALWCARLASRFRNGIKKRAERSVCFATEDNECSAVVSYISNVLQSSQERESRFYLQWERQIADMEIKRCALHRHCH